VTRPKLICDQCDEPVAVSDLVSEPSERMSHQRRAMLAAAVETPTERKTSN
jgi:hypothetical protein